MQVDFSAVIQDFDGNAVKEGDADVTLKVLSVRALISTYEDERHLSVDEKFARGKLADLVHGSAEPLELKSEDVTRLKLVIGKAFAPFVVFRALPMIDPAESAK